MDEKGETTESSSAVSSCNTFTIKVLKIEELQVGNKGLLSLMEDKKKHPFHLVSCKERRDSALLMKNLKENISAST
jgi:hypothetical protein